MTDNGDMPDLSTWTNAQLREAAKPSAQRRPIGWINSPEGRLYQLARAELFGRMTQGKGKPMKYGGGKSE